MKLYDALNYLVDSGHWDESVSVYLKNGPGVMAPVQDALDEHSRAGSEISQWYDNSVLEEPHIDDGGRWVFCVGYANGDNPEPSWDGFFTPEELFEVRQH